MLSKFSVKKPYTVVVGIVLFIILGIVSFRGYDKPCIFSQYESSHAIVMKYPGASPRSLVIEQTMATVSNIKIFNPYPVKMHPL